MQLVSGTAPSPQGRHLQGYTWGGRGGGWFPVAIGFKVKSDKNMVQFHLPKDTQDAIYFLFLLMLMLKHLSNDEKSLLYFFEGNTDILLLYLYLLQGKKYNSKVGPIYR